MSHTLVHGVPGAHFINTSCETARGPVPTKEEIFPDKTGAAPSDAKLAPFVGKVVNRFAREFLLDLADRAPGGPRLAPPPRGATRL